MGWARPLFPAPGLLHADGIDHVVDTGCQKQRPPYTTRTCGEPALLARSYTFVERWPFLSWHLVMENKSGTCNLYRHKAVCCAMAGEFTDLFVERPVREVVASFLHGCHLRPCRAIDLGANNGWMTAYMLAMGSHVISVEPATDLAAAIEETAVLNCWSPRSVVVNRFACTGKRDSPCPNPTWPTKMGHRAGGRPEGVQHQVAGVQLQELLLGQGLAAKAWPSLPRSPPAHPAHFDLIKMDGDGPEEGWLLGTAALIESGAITVGTITFEASAFTSFSPKTLRRYQRTLGYNVLRLDFADDRRFLGARGWDLFSPNGTTARLDRFGALPRDSVEEELFSVRAMRHVWRAKPNLSVVDWRAMLRVEAAQVRPWALLQFVLTRERILDPVWGGKRKRSTHWKQSHFEPRGDGLDR